MAEVAGNLARSYLLIPPWGNVYFNLLSEMILLLAVLFRCTRDAVCQCTLTVRRIFSATSCLSMYTSPSMTPEV